MPGTFEEKTEMVEVVKTEEVFNNSVATIRAIASAQTLPADGNEVYALGEFVDAYDAGLVNDRRLYVLATAKIGAYAAQQLSQDVRWECEQSGAVHDITEQLREELLAEPAKGERLQ
jgi:hypothetical protein